MKERIEDVDFIKGIMIFLMVCFHINVGRLSNLTNWVYLFHMPIFLFYSGYFISSSKPFQIRLYTLFRTLVIPFVIFEIIYISMLHFAGQLGFEFSNHVDSLSFQVIVYRIFVQPIGAYWYLHTLIVSMLVVYTVDYFKPKKLMSKIIIVGLLCYALSFLIKGIKFENELFFVIGYFFKLFAYDIFASALSLFCIAFIYLYGDTDRGSVSSLGTSFFMISFLKYIYQKLSSTVFIKVFKYLGKNTLIIVVLHPIFLNVFKLMERIFFQIDSTLIIYSLLNTIFTICLSLLTAFVFDKIKLSRLLFGKPIYVVYNDNLTR